MFCMVDLYIQIFIYYLFVSLDLVANMTYSCIQQIWLWLFQFCSSSLSQMKR